MATKHSINPVWLDLPEEHDYPATESYLSLTMSLEKVAEITASLQKAKISHFKAKDIFRASGLSLLGVSNSHVEKIVRKFRKAFRCRHCC